MTTAVGQETQAGVVILGAGPTGLGAAWRLSQQACKQKKKHEDNGKLPFLLLDESPAAGGRAASFTTAEGFTFDYGGHVLFPHEEYREFIDLLDECVDEWHSSTPIRGVWMANQLIPTPVQRNIHRLPLHTLVACLWGLSQRGRNSDEVSGEPSLLHYLEGQFGKSLTRHVMGPLNRKMWAHDPEMLGSAWSSHQSGSKEKNIPDVSVVKVLRNLVLQQDDVGWKTSAPVRYPRRGGMGAVWDQISAGIPDEGKRLNARVVEVDARTKTLYLSDGSELHYEYLVSSIPMDKLLGMMRGMPGLQAKAGKFRVARVQLYGFGLRGTIPAVLKGVHAINVPGAEYPFWRINLPGNFSPGNLPDGETTWSILCECSVPPHDTALPTREEVERGLRQMGLLPQGTEVVSVFSSSIDHGYPVPFAGRDRLLNEAQRELEELGIYSRGRFGGWRYEVSNQDHAFMQGVEVIDRLQTGKDEYTYRKTW